MMKHRGCSGFLLTLLLTACAPSVPPPTLSSTDGATQTHGVDTQDIDQQGQAAVANLQKWFASTVQDCGGSSHPAFLCGGVMLRATETNPAFYPWNPSPGSVTSGGVSFSWLRKDDSFAKMAYGYVNGFVFYPVFDTPDGKNDDIMVLCSFAVDADTVNRADAGCGPNSSYPTTSGLCHEQNIFTAEQWLVNFNAVPSGQHAHQCAFETAEWAGSHSAENFWQSIRSRSLLGVTDKATQNELRLQTWAQDIPNTLPIVAFFYLAGNAQGLANAKNDQLRFYSATGGLKMPVVSIQLPATFGANALFTYNPADQAVR